MDQASAGTAAASTAVAEDNTYSSTTSNVTVDCAPITSCAAVSSHAWIVCEPSVSPSSGGMGALAAMVMQCWCADAA